MTTYLYQASKVEKEVRVEAGRIVGVVYRNRVTGRALDVEEEGMELCYSMPNTRKKCVCNLASAELERIDADGYVLRDAQAGITLTVTYRAQASGVLTKTVQVESKQNIMIHSVTMEQGSVKHATYLWQAPYAGKTYVPQSIPRLGQPLYIGDLFFGGETPVGENTIAKGRMYCRYHTGREIDAVCEHRTYVLPPVVIGAGSADKFDAMRRAFFEYVETFARPAKFRIQYNSWYDNMLNITPARIRNSCEQVYQGFKQTGLRDLDCYVVDDGWTEYKKPLFWEFNDKFPRGFEEEAALTKSLGSKFGVWFGPRGGYTLQTVKYARLLEKIGYHVNRRSKDICTADARYIRDLCDKMCSFCRMYNVEYFKIDGFAKIPCRDKGHNHPRAKGEGLAFYTYLWEEWIKGFEKIRATQPDVCLNITSYVHCSPWFLRWVDYIWMNNAADMGYAGKGDDLSMCLNYRDARYRNFYEERQLQFPAAHMYNHEPCYAMKNYNTSRPWKKNQPVVYTDEQFRTYMRGCLMRGSGLLELYFTPEMMDGQKWQIAADLLQWAEKHFDLLSTSQFFGGKPEKGQVYGYYAVRGDQHIVMVRNSGPRKQSYEFDLLGIGKIQGELQPYEILYIEKI